ncbi:MAG TPA: glycosyltransferase family 4 protein [Pyrinomonadaceae bacterium]
MTTVEKNRLWLICELYFPEVNATGHYVTQIGTGLADEYDVNVICAQPNYLSRGIRAPKRDTHHGVKIVRVWSTTLNKDFLPFRILNMLTVGLSMFVRSLVSLRRGDRVLVVTAPPSLPYTTALASLLKGASYTVVLHDLYPDILVALGRTSRQSHLSGLIEHLNRWLYKHAAALIVVGRDMERTVACKAEGLETPIYYIPNWADLEAVSPMPRSSNELLNDLDIANNFVLMYAGNIGHPTDIETIIDAAEILRDDRSVRFVFVGSGAKKRWLDREVSRRSLDNVFILGQLPRDEQNIFLNACDIGIISLVPGMRGTAMPSRTYNIIAAGRPIIALTEEGSELAQVIEEDDLGWWIPPGQPERLVDTIRVAMSDRHRLDEMGQRARDSAVEKYAPEIAIRRYKKALR